MSAFSRGIVLLAVAGHIGLTMADAGAKPGGATGGHGAPSAGHGVNGGANGVNGGHVSGFSVGHIGAIGLNGVYGGHVDGPSDGHIGNIGVNSGREGVYGKSDPAPAPTSPFGGDPLFFSDPTTAFAGSTSGACGTELQLPDTSWYTDPVDGIEVISQQTQNYIAFCGCNTQACVADALDKYADALDQAMAPPPPAPGLAPPPQRRLPRAIRELPRVVHEVAKRVRTAQTAPAAQKAMQDAIDIIHKTVAKTIPLMRANDPDAKAAATRAADLVADTLNTAKSALMRADTL